MTLAIRELARARETAARLLEGLGLDAYLFEVEPAENGWQLRLECATQDGWKSQCIAVDKHHLLAALDDAALYDTLRDDWRHRCSDCKRTSK